MSNAKTGAAPAGAAPAAGYYSRPELWGEAEKYQQALPKYQEITSHMAQQLQQQEKDIAGMVDALQYLQLRLNLAVTSGDETLIEGAKLRYDQLYEKYRIARLDYGKGYDEYARLYSAYDKTAKEYEAYAARQTEAEKQWRSTIRDSATVGAELQQVQEQLRKLTQQDSTGRILTGLGNWAQNVLASSSGFAVPGQEYTPQNAKQIAELEAREKLLQEEYQWGLQFEDEALRSSEEFKTLSQQGLEKWQQMRAQQAQLKGKSALEHNAAAYAAANENPFVTAFNQVVQQYREDDSYQQPNEKWSQEQLDRFGYLLMTETAKAWEYAEQVNNQISQEKAQEQKDAIAQKATASGWAGVGHTIGALATAPLALADVMDNLAEFAGRGTVTSKDSLTPYDYSQAVVGGISKKLNEAGTIDESVPVIGGKGWGDLYSIGFSTAQSLLAGVTGNLAGTGALTLAQFFGQGAAAGIDSGIESGAKGWQAMAYGLLSGAAEGFAEKIGVDRLFKLGSARTFKGFVKNLLKQSAAEGIEEAVTAVLDSAADRIILGENSTFRKSVSEYEQSMSHEDAVRLAWTETIGGIVFDGLSGAISGGLGAGVTTAGANVVESIHNHRQTKPAATEPVPQGAAEVPAAAAPATFQEENQRQVAENLGGKNAAQAATAQLAGQENTQNDGGMTNGAEDAAGADILSGSGQRNDGAGAGEQAGGVAGRAGQTAPRGRLTADQLRTQTERSHLGSDLRVEKVSAQSLGIAAGTQEATLRVVPQNVWDEGMATKARQIYEETGYNVTYVQGAIRIKGNDGRIRTAGGVCTDGGQIVVQCDSVRFTAEQLADHEAYHAMIRAYGADGGRINDLAVKSILERFTPEEFDRVMDDYVTALRGIIDVAGAQTGEEFQARMQQVLEEVLADAYAGMNRFGGGAVQFSEPIQQALVNNGISRPQNQENGVRQTNGPNDNGQKNTTRTGGEMYAASDVNLDILRMVNRVVSGNFAPNERVQLGIVSDSIAETIKAITGVDVRGFSMEVEARQIEHILKDHGKNGKADQSMANPYDIAKMEFALLAPDDIRAGGKTTAYVSRVNGRNKPADTVLYEKNLGQKSYYVIQAVPDTKKKTLYIVTAFIGEGGYKKGEPQSTNTYSPGATPEAESAVSPSKTIPHGKDAVNENFAVEDDGEYAALEGEYSAEQAQWREMWFRDRLGEEGYAKYQEAQRKQEQARKEESRQHQRAQSQQRREDIRQRQEQQLQALKERAEKERSEVRPVKAKKALRRVLFDIFSIPAGQKTELGKLIDGYADRLIQNGRLTEADYRSFFDRMYESGVMEVPADEFYQMGRDYLKHGKIYVDAQTLADLGDDWADLRRRAFAAGIYLTRDSADMGIDQWHHALDTDIPGLMPRDATDMRSVLERIIQIAEEGKGEKMSLAEYTRVLAGQESISEDAFLDNMERQLDWALRTFAVSAGIEMEVRQQQKDTAAGSRRESARLRAQLAQERETRKELARLAQERKQLRQLQEKTLKQLQWLSKNRDKAPEDLRTAMDAVLSDLDIYAIGAANASGWSKKYNATWKDIVDIYLDAKENDPNFLPSKELETMVHRLQDRKIEDLDIGALNDLYKAAVGLRTEFYNRNNVLGDEMNRLMAEVYADSVDEINAAPGKFSANKLKKLFNEAQLTAMNVLERMGGWNPKGAFYSMAKQLERGERDYRAYIVKANRMLQAFLENNEDWVKKADGQGKDGIWYEVKFHPLTKLGYGDKPIFGTEEVTVHMTPMQKIHLYLESKNVDNLRHMVGGRTFVDKALYRDGKRQEALAQGVTVKMAPETVKKLVSDLTEQERELAGLLEQYYNQFATGEINRISNILYGYDKAMGKNYAPIYTNKNYTSTSFELDEIMAEHAGNLKARIHSKNPSYNISALDAFERHAEKTARFVGMAIPTRNWDMLINWHSNSSSMSDIITHKWGDDGLKYVTDLIQSLQTGASVKTDSISEGLAKLQSNYISSVFGFNVSIVAKQLGSIPMAGAYLDMKNIPSPAQVKNIDRALIAKYTQDLDWRTMGYSMPETKFLKDNPNKLQSSKVLGFLFGGDAITAMDGWAASTLWPWAENKVRREHPELDVGTQAEIDSGASPFYKKVAEEFENAVSRSQSVSDEMHQGSLRKSKNPLAKAFTMFRSDSAQSYNALRQMIGEAQYHIRSGSDPQAVKAAKRSVGAVAGAMLLNALWGEAVSLLVALVKNGAKYYRDDEEELTAGSVIGEAAGNMLASVAGTVTGGEELYDLLAGIFFGESRYATEVPGMEQFNDLLDTVAGSAKGLVDTVGDAASVARSGGNGWQHLRENSGAMLGAVKDVAEAIAAYGFGIPVGNAEAYLLGALKWISPEFAAAYEDAFQKVNKGDLSGCEGEVLADRVGRVLRGRGLDASDDVSAVIAELYEAGYRTAMPSDVPRSVSINGESREMNAYQQQCYGNIWAGTVDNALEELIVLDGFQYADAEEQEKMFKAVYDYAAEQAKSTVFDVDMSSTAAKNAEMIQSGLSLAEVAVLRATQMDATDYLDLVAAGLDHEAAFELTEDLSELVPEEGSMKVTDVQRWRTCVDFATHEGVQLSALSSVMKPEQYLKVSTACNMGVSPDVYVRYYEIRIKFDADGNGTYTQAEVKKAIDSMGQGMTTKQKAVLWQVVSGASSAKNNPYSVEVGQKLLDALKKSKGSKSG